MNERIKELWEESTVSTWPRPGKFTAGEYDYHLKKFAELIVRECAETMGSEIVYNDNYNERNKAISDMMVLVKKHFGVEK